MDKHLHIVCLQVPYPPDYGGVIDLFWKLKYLRQQGISIYLHCFDDGRGAQPALKEYCKEVFYYRRKKGMFSFSLSVPYMVRSRRSKQLERNLLKDNYPILLEGIHCSYLLHKNKLPDRNVFIRLHNDEAAYYRQLATQTTALFSRWYYLLESLLLKKYEPATIRKARAGFSVSRSETKSFTGKGLDNVDYLPLFLPWEDVQGVPGQGSFCLYHGNLSVEENEKAAIWLIEQVFREPVSTFIIAGRNPTERLKRKITGFSHIRLIENPDIETMNTLIRDAHIHVLPSFSETGIKLKLLHALFEGRFCITNLAMTAGSGLAPACIIAGSAAVMKEKIAETLLTPFTAGDLAERKKILLQTYDNIMTVKKLVSLIFGTIS